MINIYHICVIFVDNDIVIYFTVGNSIFQLQEEFIYECFEEIEEKSGDIAEYIKVSCPCEMCVTYENCVALEIMWRLKIDRQHNSKLFE